MDWANERYVRLYTRDTLTWKLIGWEGRAVLPQILRKVDRSGVLELGGLEPADAVAAVVDAPIEIVRVAVGRLVERGAIEVGPDVLVIPHFLEAQETPQSDAHRAAEYRARRREKARIVTKRDVCVTKRDETVTRRHTASLLPSFLPSDSPNRPPNGSTDDPDYPADFEKLWKLYPKRGGANPKEPAFEAWRARLRAGASVEELESAVRRYARFCEATAKVGTETVQQTASFFGPKKRGWKESWDIPQAPVARDRGFQP